MSDIKIKCFNIDKNDWELVPYIIFNGLNPLEVEGFLDENDKECLIEDGHKVAYFIGLHDSEGNEVYEYDVVQIDNGEIEFTVMQVGTKLEDGTYGLAVKESMDGKIYGLDDSILAGVVVGSELKK